MNYQNSAANATLSGNESEESQAQFTFKDTLSSQSHKGSRHYDFGYLGLTSKLAEAQENKHETTVGKKILELRGRLNEALGLLVELERETTWQRLKGNWTKESRNQRFPPTISETGSDITKAFESIRRFELLTEAGRPKYTYSGDQLGQENQAELYTKHRTRTGKHATNGGARTTPMTTLSLTTSTDGSHTTSCSDYATDTHWTSQPKELIDVLSGNEFTSQATSPQKNGTLNWEQYLNYDED